MKKKKIILIDDDHRIWGPVFDYIIKDVYSSWAEFEALQDISDEAISTCYTDNPDALFIQDNDLTKDPKCPVTNGMHWLMLYGKKRSIVLHSGDSSPDIGFKAAQYGARLYMKKDDPRHMMSNEDMRNQIIEFNQVVIKHLELAPEMIWITYIRMGMIRT